MMNSNDAHSTTDLDQPTSAPSAPAARTGSGYWSRAGISGNALPVGRKAGATPTRILIAEDDPVSRTVLERSLQAGGTRSL